ncbi:MAG: Hsp20/alpha crystallin family protein [Proteobacteria bacterium]|nr:MAG: Hsp20/alpha crystallin family protein [Pseudomonadota bacterium]
MRTQDILFPNFFFDQALRSARSAAPADSLVEETAEGYFIQLDIPGVPKENVRISAENRHLVIEAERAGRSSAKLRRVFTLPDDVNAEAIAAQVQDGVLELKLPKKEQAKPKQILVQDGKESFFSRLLGNGEKSA